MSLAQWVEERILSLRNMDADAQRDRVTTWWAPLDRLQRFVLLKMITGELRVGVSQTLVVRALAQAPSLPVATIAARLMGEWTPAGDWFTSLMATESTDVDQSRPYPFFLASPLEEDPSTLGEPADWLIEWKWDGIRAQLVRRAGNVHLWSRGEEVITHRFPEITAAATRLPDGTVIDGEVLAFRERPSAAVLRVAATHRTPEAGCADGAVGSGGVHGLRPARRATAAISVTCRFGNDAIG